MNEFPYDAAIFLGLLLVAFISWLLFARLTMARIEKQLKKEGIETAQWDGIGVRAVWYAWAILFRGTILDQKDDILINNPAVNRHATKRDRWVAGVLIGSLLILLVMSLFHYFLE